MKATSAHMKITVMITSSAKSDASGASPATLAAAEIRQYATQVWNATTASVTTNMYSTNAYCMPCLIRKRRRFVDMALRTIRPRARPVKGLSLSLSSDSKIEDDPRGEPLGGRALDRQVVVGDGLHRAAQLVSARVEGL